LLINVHDKVNDYMTEPTTAASNLARADWIQGPTRAEVPDQSTYLLDYGTDGIVIINFNGELTAFRNSCLHQDMPIHAGYLARDGLLLCPWHNWCYDVKNGACLTAPGAQLEQYPVRVAGDQIWVNVGPNRAGSQ
jgi:nitrite reductase/ring-hydroxylating ferredoxin subunit